MTSRSRATEIPVLVNRLGSRKRARADAARARLAIIGARAVEALVEALEGDDNRIRASAMSLLALIQDPRGREPLMAMLLDRDRRMREIAVRSLARFPSAQSVAALERVLKSDKSIDVRVATVTALIEQYEAGQEHAIRQVLAILSDADEDGRLRVAALALVPRLRYADRRAILRRLKQDPSEDVASRARDLERSREPGKAQETATIRAALTDLASRDYAVWNTVVHGLAGMGASVVPALVEEMRRRSDDPEYCARVGMVLKGLGPRRGRVLARALDEVDEPIPLQVLVEAVGALGEKSLVYRLKDVIERIVARAGELPSPNGFDPMQRVRAKAHLELARVGSRVAVQDLRDALADSDRRVELEVLAAVELIGKRDEIPDLLRAFVREERFMRERIAGVVRAIMRRERIRRNNSMFRALGPRHRRALESILESGPARARRAAPRRAARK